MRLKNRVPRIEHRSPNPTEGLEHLSPESVAIIRWLAASRVEHVLIGALAEAIRGEKGARGPVAIVPAPYRRNLERLARALAIEHARLRSDVGSRAGADPLPVKLTADKLAQNTRWPLRVGATDLDIEAGIRAAAGSRGVPSYQELLYEAGRFELEPGLSVEVASPEDIEHFAHLRRAGVAPEITITRQAPPAGDGAQPRERSAEAPARERPAGTDH
jgi:hypothetical protein